ncbi:hypothetical protein [Aeoliella sp. SH292]|uniref:hypothetical protein n=1 Tax=Aeoliella sp. SH292 TaxID=3454464 RepID=UPI003F995CE5
MLDFDVKRSTRRCAATSVEFAPGSKYYSVLEAEGAEVVRRDYARDAWQGPPASAIGWWESHVPLEGVSKPKLAPSEVALELFDRWRDDPEHQDSVYILALFLVRKRVFRFAEAAFATVSSDGEVLRVYCASRAAEYDVAVVPVTRDRAAEIQQQLMDLLYSDCQ